MGMRWQDMGGMMPEVCFGDKTGQRVVREGRMAPLRLLSFCSKVSALEASFNRTKMPWPSTQRRDPSRSPDRKRLKPP